MEEDNRNRFQPGDLVYLDDTRTLRVVVRYSGYTQLDGDCWTMYNYTIGATVTFLGMGFRHNLVYSKESGGFSEGI